MHTCFMDSNFIVERVRGNFDWWTKEEKGKVMIIIILGQTNLFQWMIINI